MDLIDRQPEERTNKRTETHACDSISRRAALKIVTKHIGVDGDRACLIDVGKTYGEIYALPPVQPELIRCKDCKYFETAGNLLDGLCRRHRIPTTMYSTGFCSMAERREE